MLDIEALLALPRYAGQDRETLNQTIEAAHQLALDQYLPHNRKSDLQEPQMVNGKVELIPEIAAAVAAFNDAGFIGMYADTDDGGLQMPFLATSICDAIFAAANPGTVAYPLLARAAANLLKAHANADQQARYMRPIIEGRFFGTMCLSEPQAGSSLGDIKTLAEPIGDGRYKIRGAKMWISAGDHELGENIVHLVLAKIVGAPPGVKGISLFIVPRFRLDDEGRPAERNDVVLAGLNHKMGQRGSVNTFLKFGENDDCTGELVGEPHQGLAYMFHMMNEERIGVGMGAVMQGYVGYRYSLQYARERQQGRHADQRDPSAAPVAIIEHADIRRMLLAQRAAVEGSFALGLYAAWLVDRTEHAGPSEGRDEEAELLDLLTPVIKAWCSDHCLRANELAIQILGGYGYTREYPVEQCYRDNRINPIHEGSNGIQALDLLGRKAGQANGRGLRALLTRIEQCCATASEFDDLRAHAEALKRYAAALGRTSATLLQAMAAGQIRSTLANAHHYLQAVGDLCIGWMWLWQALALKRSPRQQEPGFVAGKLGTLRYFFQVELPRIEHALALLASADDSALSMPVDGF
ncbi:acyl-CoA dehydrogenase [Pseudoxanthomonas sp. CAU 1598]|uniref:Acyl-CoA dehydrogenase n=2 Tax=Pseudomarimonas arenosa TaxID=2774145 RepID=A0AAW3ZPT0_9GAMM|nr:acyl-CoA dehydrogenase [Pseudomarimonas arenosa]MBD8527157.1 acyl-CoA dehydrogenase [Pseudomarimonas arenosa]